MMLVVNCWACSLRTRTVRVQIRLKSTILITKKLLQNKRKKRPRMARGWVFYYNVYKPLLKFFCDCIFCCFCVKMTWSCNVLVHSDKKTVGSNNSLLLSLSIYLSISLYLSLSLYFSLSISTFHILTFCLFQMFTKWNTHSLIGIRTPQFIYHLSLSLSSFSHFFPILFTIAHNHSTLFLSQSHTPSF